MGDLEKILLTSALSVVATLAGTWIRGRIDDHRAAKDTESGVGWRNMVMRELSVIKEAQHVQMRHELIHDAEKAIANGSITTAERQSWWESYNAYAALGQNGYIADYWLRIQGLPIREV